MINMYKKMLKNRNANSLKNKKPYNVSYRDPRPGNIRKMVRFSVLRRNKSEPYPIKLRSTMWTLFHF